MQGFCFHFSLIRAQILASGPDMRAETQGPKVPPWFSDPSSFWALGFPHLWISLAMHLKGVYLAASDFPAFLKILQ